MYKGSEDYDACVSYRARGGFCTIRVKLVNVTNGWKVPIIIPAEYLPDVAVYVPLAHRMSDHVAQLWIPSKESAKEDPYLYVYTSIDVTWGTAICGLFTYSY